MFDADVKSINSSAAAKNAYFSKYLQYSNSATRRSVYVCLQPDVALSTFPKYVLINMKHSHTLCSNLCVHTFYKSGPWLMRFELPSINRNFSIQIIIFRKSSKRATQISILLLVKWMGCLQMIRPNICSRSGHNSVLLNHNDNHNMN